MTLSLLKRVWLPSRKYIVAWILLFKRFYSMAFLLQADVSILDAICFAFSSIFQHESAEALAAFCCPSSTSFHFVFTKNRMPKCRKIEFQLVMEIAECSCSARALLILFCCLINSDAIQLSITFFLSLQFVSEIFITNEDCTLQKFFGTACPPSFLPLSFS